MFSMGRMLAAIRRITGCVNTENTSFDLATASYNTTLTSNAKGTASSASAMIASYDGKHFFLSDPDLDRIIAFPLTTDWDFSSYNDLVYEIRTGGDTVAPSGMYFKTDGLTLFVLASFEKKVHKYTLTTAWDLGTASYVEKSTNALAQGSELGTLYFSSSGLKMYTCDVIGNIMYQYSLAIAWDITSTITYDSKSLDFNAESGTMRGGIVSDDGAKVFAWNELAERIYQYDLGTAWDISTDTYIGNKLIGGASLTAMCFRGGGTDLAVYLGTVTDKVITRWHMSSSFDISTASDSGDDIEYLPKDDDVRCIAVNGINLYTFGTQYNYIYQYEFSDSTDIRTCGAIHRVLISSLNAANGSPEGMDVSCDGKHLYIVDVADSLVYQYDFGTAWDLSTLTYASKSLATGSVTSHGVSLSPDGTKLYVLEANSDAVREFTLSTAYDVSTGTFINRFDVTVNTATPREVAISSGGNQIFLLNFAVDTITQYKLNTPWDVTSMVYEKNFSVNAQEDHPNAFAMQPDGSRMYVSGDNNNAIFEYTL